MGEIVLSEPELWAIESFLLVEFKFFVETFL